MTRTETSMWAAIHEMRIGPVTCSSLGAYLWGKSCRVPQSYARPAGKLLYQMERLGIARCSMEGRHFVWRLTAGWEQALKRYHEGRNHVDT